MNKPKMENILISELRSTEILSNNLNHQTCLHSETDKFDPIPESDQKLAI